jgi:hypothetical protein
MRGGEHGTRNPALAAGRADPGDYSVVAVLRPLTSGDRVAANQAPLLAEPFFRTAPSFPLVADRALFFENSGMTRHLRIIGSENACRTTIRDN